ncbi:MAG: DUF1284 domain-containing protein [bacterium]|nr:DUF1284 domain-containing protein [bacterium]
MPKDFDVRLRGHHLSALYYFSYYRRNEWQVENYKRSLASGYGRRQAEKNIKVLEKICANNIRVKLTDRPDEICQGCLRKKESCRKFIPYGISAASDDRASTYNLGFKIGKVYRSRYLLRKLRKSWFFNF